MGENPEQARGIERFLVNGLRDSGLVGISADTLTVEGRPRGQMLVSFARRDTRICSFSTSCTTRKPNV